MRLLRHLTIAALLTPALAPSAGAAQDTMPTPMPAPAGREAQARRLSGSAPVVDGLLDDAAWASAIATGGFIQKQPAEGEPSPEATDVRFLYDDDALYVAARMHKAAGSVLQAPIGRRDGVFQAEFILITLDSYLDRRTAYTFGVTASGVRMDWYHPRDVEVPFDDSFDPVYTARAAIDSLGWTAEFRIPFSQLRFLDRPVQTWGLNMNRWFPDRSEDSFWVMVPPSENGWASRFGVLTGIEGIEPSRRIELMPYVAGNATLRGAVDADDPFAEERDWTARAGGDVKMGLGPNLTLDGTINPDFGQVEADPAEVNLSAFETFFSERRPFFLEGSQLFESEGPGFFYSRRIGASPKGSPLGDFADVPQSTTILGATKITGRLASGLSTGALVAVTERERARSFDLASGTFETVEVEPLAGYGVARLRQEFGADGSTAGVILTGVRRDLAADEPLAGLVNRDAIAGAGDWNLRFQGGEYQLTGHLGFSRIAGDSTAILRAQTSSARYFQRPDADYVTLDGSKTSLAGWTGGLNLERVSGQHWLGQVYVSAESPGFEINDVGQLSTADDVFGLASVTYRETKPWRGLQSWRAALTNENSWNFGGTRTYSSLTGNASITLRNFWQVTLLGLLQPRSLSDDLTRGGPLMGTGREWVTIASLFNSFSASTRWRARVYYGESELGGRTYRLSGGLAFRPAPRWQLSIDPNFLRSINPRQFVTALPGGHPETFGTRYVFSTVDRTTLLAQIRLDYAFTPDLTLELYAEPFAASGRFDQFGELAAAESRDLRVYGETPGTSITAAGDGTFQVTDAGDAFTFARSDFNIRSFRSNAVLRWEWAPGSTLFLVWQQDRASGDTSGEHVGPGALWESLEATGDHVLALKATYWIPID